MHRAGATNGTRYLIGRKHRCAVLTAAAARTLLTGSQATEHRESKRAHLGALELGLLGGLPQRCARAIARLLRLAPLSTVEASPVVLRHWQATLTTVCVGSPDARTYTSSTQVTAVSLRLLSECCTRQDAAGTPARLGLDGLHAGGLALVVEQQRPHLGQPVPPRRLLLRRQGLRPCQGASLQPALSNTVAVCHLSLPQQTFVPADVELTLRRST